MGIVASRHALAVALALGLGLGEAAVAQEEPLQEMPGQVEAEQQTPEQQTPEQQTPEQEALRQEQADRLTDCMVDASGEAEGKVFEELILALDDARNLALGTGSDPALEGATNDKTVEKAEAMAAAVQKLARRACAPLLKDLPTEVYRVGIRGYMDEMGAETRARINAKK